MPGGRAHAPTGGARHSRKKKIFQKNKTFFKMTPDVFNPSQNAII
jgi:hypothetical protein